MTHEDWWALRNSVLILGILLVILYLTRRKY